MNGYWHADYVQSFAEFGKPRELHACGGWILERTIPGFADSDAMGCYPLFVCADWSRLAADLNEIGTDLVSLAVVSNPFGDYDEALLRRCFPDLVTPFKEHYVIDLRQDINKVVSVHHRYRARRALKDVRVEVCHQPLRFLDEWCSLYQHLIDNLRFAHF